MWLITGERGNGWAYEIARRDFDMSLITSETLYPCTEITPGEPRDDLEINNR